MKVGRAFHHDGTWWVHVKGVPLLSGHLPGRSVAGAVKTRQGWCYFRRATKEERDARLADIARSEARAAQFAEERRRAMVAQ